MARQPPEPERQPTLAELQVRIDAIKGIANAETMPIGALKLNDLTERLSLIEALAKGA